MDLLAPVQAFFDEPSYLAARMVAVLLGLAGWRRGVARPAGLRHLRGGGRRRRDRGRTTHVAYSRMAVTDVAMTLGITIAIALALSEAARVGRRRHRARGVGQVPGRAGGRGSARGGLGRVAESGDRRRPRGGRLRGDEPVRPPSRRRACGGRRAGAAAGPRGLARLRGRPGDAACLRRSALGGARAGRPGRGRRARVAARRRTGRPRARALRGRLGRQPPPATRTSTATCCRSSPCSERSRAAPALVPAALSPCSCRSVVDRDTWPSLTCTDTRVVAAAGSSATAQAGDRRRGSLDAQVPRIVTPLELPGPGRSTTRPGRRRLAPRRPATLSSLARSPIACSPQPTSTRARRASTPTWRPTRAALLVVRPGGDLSGPWVAVQAVATFPCRWHSSASDAAPSRWASPCSSRGPCCSASRSPPAASWRSYFGNSLFVWGALIGVVLAGLRPGTTSAGRSPTGCRPRLLRRRDLARRAARAGDPVRRRLGARAGRRMGSGPRLSPLVAAIALFAAARASSSGR